MSRFYVPKGSVKGDTITVTGREAHHIIDVMRLKTSDEVVVFDGSGTEYLGVIKDTDRKSLTIKVTKKRQTSDTGMGTKTTLIQSIPKKEKMDYIIEKATELGVSAIMPVVTERAIPQWEDSKRELRLERWKKIAMEASKQCGRSDIPAISGISDLETALETVKDSGLKLIAALRDDAVSLKAALRSSENADIVIAIGPEGDFTDNEITKAKGRGFKPVSLGPLVLKSDTAGLAVLAILNYEYAK